MKAALDTNVLAYTEGVNGADMQSAALAVVVGGLTIEIRRTMLIVVIFTIG